MHNYSRPSGQTIETLVGRRRQRRETSFGLIKNEEKENITKRRGGRELLKPFNFSPTLTYK